MSEIRIDQILTRLDSRDPHEAWSSFIDDQAPLILQVVRHFERDPDNVADCFQFVCERLCEDRFRRLRKFKPDGPAKFSTWLRAVTRNLCLDWQRRQFGRRRVFRSVSQLSELDQEVFRCVHERGQSEQETLLALASQFPDLSEQSVSESIARINNALTTGQSWLVRARAAFNARRPTVGSDNHQAVAIDPRSNPETQAIADERALLINRALRRLPDRERLLIRMRFEEDLTLEQIAKLLELGNAQRVDRQIKQILTRLRGEFDSSGTALAEKMKTRP